MRVARLSLRSIVLMTALGLLAILGGGTACTGSDGEGGNDETTFELTVTGSDGDGVAASFSAPCNAGFCPVSYTCSGSDGTCAYEVETATTVRLQARPEAGRRLVAWSGNCTTVAGFPDSARIAINADVIFDCEAEFAPDVTAGCNNPVIIQDDFGADAGWLASATVSNANVTGTVDRQATGGNPDGYRRMQHLFTGSAAISYFHTFATTYDPSTQGAIDHVNYYEDQILVAPPFAGAAVGTAFTMTQGGNRTALVLRPPGGAFTTTTWERTSLLDITAASVPGVDFAGGPITFGYLRSNTNSGTGSYTITHGIDNFRVEICR